MSDRKGRDGARRRGRGSIFSPRSSGQEGLETRQHAPPRDQCMWWLLGGVDSNRFLLLLIAPDYVCIECVYLEGPEPGRVRRQIEKVRSGLNISSVRPKVRISHSLHDLAVTEGGAAATAVEAAA